MLNFSSLCAAFTRHACACVVFYLPGVSSMKWAERTKHSQRAFEATQHERGDNSSSADFEGTVSFPSFYL